MVETLGIIGTGMIGSTLARLASAAEMDVIIANSRGPETLTRLVDDLGPRVRATTAAELATAADIVIAAIPLSAFRALPSEQLAGKVVVETMNHYPDRDGDMAELLQAERPTSELVQEYLEASYVVKAFNNIDFRRLFTLARPTGSGDRSALPFAGDSMVAKLQTATLMDRLGYDSVDIGSLSESWRMEPGTPVYCGPYFPTAMPASLSDSDRRAWFFSSPGERVDRVDVERLTGSAVRSFGSRDAASWSRE